MELVNGIPITDYIEANGGIPEDRAKIILFDIICAVKYY
jgi:serine/threonine protein kinase